MKAIPLRKSVLLGVSGASAAQLARTTEPDEDWSSTRAHQCSLMRLLGAVVLGSVFQVSAICAPGDLYLSQAVEGVISKIAPDGTKSTFALGLDYPSGLAFDHAGNLFVSVGSQPGSILKFSPSGEMSVFASGISIPGGLAFDG